MASEIKTISKELLGYDAALSLIADEKKKLTDKIEELADEIKAGAVAGYLSTIDVEELNRDKQGIRIQLLRDAGFNTIADIRRAEKSRIVSINGIGDHGAAVIIKSAKKIENAAKKNTGIKLTVEGAGAKETELIRLLYSLKMSLPSALTAEELLETYHNDIQDYSLDLKTGISRIFASKEKKELSDKAEKALTEIYDTDFCERAKECLAGHKKLKIADKTTAKKDFAQNVAEYYSMLDSVCGIKVTTGDDTTLDDALLEEIEAVDVDTSLLKCSLRKYQYFGVQYILNQKRVLLGDEMGLGKTVEAISALASVAADGPAHFIVVCPAAVLTNWVREIGLHSMLSAWSLHSHELAQNLNEWTRCGGVGVTTYEMSGKIVIPDDITIKMLVVDEAHYIKNPEANRTKSVIKIINRSERVLFMTGTPLENKLDEMQFLISCLQPKIAKEIAGNLSVSSTEGFRRMIAPVYIRRRRDDVLKELPDLIESEEWCSPTKSETENYKTAVAEGNFAAMRRISWNEDDVSTSSKGERLLSILENAKAQGRKVIVFSFFLGTIDAVSKLVADEEGKVFGPVTGGVSPENRQKIVDEFSAAEGFAVLLSQIGAGGTGLNIQAASVIVLCEPQLKPSIENQAIARAYRMGQVNSVLVYRLLCEHCADERIMDMLKNKQKIFNDYADTSVSGDETLEKARIEEIIEKEKELLGIAV